MTAPEKDGSRSEGFWEEQDSHGLAFSLEFRPEKPVCACAVPPLSQKSGAEIPEPFTHTGACLLFVLAVTISLGVDKRRALAIYSLLLFPFQRAKRRLTVNTETEAHLSLLSETLTVVNIQLEAHFFMHHEMQTGGQL